MKFERLVLTKKQRPCGTFRPFPIKGLKPKDNFSVGNYVKVRKGTKIFSINNQLNFILDENVICKITNHYKFEVLFLSPQQPLLNIPLCKPDLIGCGIDSWSVMVNLVEPYVLPSNSIYVFDSIKE